jgi:uncharacterized membrane protein
VSEAHRPAEKTSPAFWRSFLVYTGSLVGVFAVLLGLLYGIGVRGLVVVFIALVLSGVMSYFVLDKQRTAFAAAVEARVERRRAAGAARAAREDEIADRLIEAEDAARREVPSGGSRGA